MTGQFRSSVWDPVHIVSQIICMQSIYYCSLGAWISVLDYIVAADRSLDQVFGYEELNFKDTTGRVIAVAFVINALSCAFGLWYVVRRTKLCLDFTATMHLLHLVLCWAYNSRFPRTLAWWLVHVVATAIMTVLGEYMCMRTELKAIPIAVGSKANL